MRCFVLLILFSFFIFNSCVKFQIEESYCFSNPNLATNYNIKLDTLEKSFCYVINAGLLNDTIKGDYVRDHNLLNLKALKGYVNKQEIQALDSLQNVVINVIDFKTNQPIPFVEITINQEKKVKLEEKGSVANLLLNDGDELLFNHFGYRPFKCTISGVGIWEVKLIPLLPIDYEHLIFKIRKNKLKSLKVPLLLEKCN